MTDTINDSSTQTPRYRNAYAQLVERLRALPDEQLVAVNIDVMSAVRTAEGVVPKIAGQRANILEQLPKFDIQAFDQLESYALALGHAHTLYDATLQPLPELQEMANEGVKQREILLAEVTTLIKRGVLAAAVIGNLKGANGYKNLTADLFSLSQVIRGNWEKIAARTTITESELNAAENLADKINNILGQRQQSPELQARAARDRQAAFTLFTEAYDEVRSAIAFVRRKQGDVDNIIPSLYAGRGGSSKKKADAPPNDPSPTSPANPQPGGEHDVPTPNPTTVPATGTPATPAHTATPAATPTPASLAAHGPFV